MKHVADGAHHGGPLLRRTQETAPVELAFQVLEQCDQLGASRGPCAGEIEPFRRGPIAFGGAAERWFGYSSLQPFIADEQNGLWQAQGSERRVDRRGYDGVGERDQIGRASCRERVESEVVTGA